jgi:archaellum component FlaC
MTDETTNLVLEHLRAIRGEISSVKDEMRTMKTEISALRLQVGAVSKLVEQCVEDIATVRVRLDRIDRRLDLVDAAK